jgi:hypothetical protein
MRATRCLMKPLKTATLFLLLVPALIILHAKPKKQDKPSAEFNQARYVYVEAIDGQEFDPRLNPDDRQAIANVESALQDWNRYTLTVKRDEAELIFVVRKGRLAEARVGVDAGDGSSRVGGQISNHSGSSGQGSSGQGSNGQGLSGPGSNGLGPNGPASNASGREIGGGVGGEVGPPDDLLEVYLENPDHTRGAMVWQRTQQDGLDSPNVSLLKELKNEVERAYPNQTASQTKKP